MESKSLKLCDGRGRHNNHFKGVRKTTKFKKLIDLPQEAKKVAATIEELKLENGELKRNLRQSQQKKVEMEEAEKRSHATCREHNGEINSKKIGDAIAMSKQGWIEQGRSDAIAEAIEIVEKTVVEKQFSISAEGIIQLISALQDLR